MIRSILEHSLENYPKTSFCSASDRGGAPCHAYLPIWVVCSYSSNVTTKPAWLLEGIKLANLSFSSLKRKRMEHVRWSLPELCNRNHCRQTAAAAARFGLDCLLVLSGENEEIPSGNLLLDHLFGAQAFLTTQDKREKTLQEVFESRLGEWQASLSDSLWRLKPGGGCCIPVCIARADGPRRRSGLDYFSYIFRRELKQGWSSVSMSMVLRARYWGSVWINRLNGCKQRVADLVNETGQFLETTC